MAKPENDENRAEKQQTWSTLLELLLACAVQRHGTDSWDTIATEIHKQNTTPLKLTALDCHHKYNELKRRFDSPGGSEDKISISSVPWLEDLRKLRVDELRREVERYNLSISLLELKVKRLEDERAKTLKETETGNPDLCEIVETTENHLESNVLIAESKDNNHGTGTENTKTGQEIEEPVEDKLNRVGGEDKDDNLVKEDSCKGSCESVGKDSGKSEPIRDLNDSPPEFIESMEESKGEEEDAKETSDVQSSASLPVQQNQPDNENQSPTVNTNSTESQPLFSFIDILRSHPITSQFSRQNTSDYEKIIKQHIDIDIIRSRVEENHYEESSKTKFFRDVLLLINNVKVFYGERSSEYDSIKQLNQLIKKQMMMTTLIHTSLIKDESFVASKEEEVIVTVKPKMLVPIIACRKRSSLAVIASEPLNKKTKVVDENLVSGEVKDSDKDEEPIAPKKVNRERGRFATTKKVEKTSLPSKGQPLNDSSEPKKTDNGGSKKQNAASFLKRMKGVSSSETEMETKKGTGSSNEKRGNSKNDNNIEAGKPLAKRSSGKKPVIEKSSPAKKNTGTASKRDAVPSTKRDSEAIEKETGSSGRPRKRTKKL